MKIGFIGLGNMGSPIAGNLLAAGHQLTVFNRTREKAEPLQQQGAQIADSAGEAALDSEAVFSMLADDAAVKDAVLGEQGITRHLAPGAAHISLRTISLAMARELAREHASRRQGYLSAPVFGRPDAAQAKRLLVIAAGDAQHIQRFQILFDAIGRRTFVAGPEPWQANLIKLNGNFMLGCMMEAFGESFASVRKAGLDHHLFFEIMTELFGSPVYKNYGGIIADEKFVPPAFPLKLGLKDVRLGLEAAAEFNVPMPFASVLRDQFLAALSNGQEALDWSSVAKIAARNAGLLPETETSAEPHTQGAK